MNGDRYIDDPRVIRLFRLYSLIQGAKLEGLGMRRRGPSCTVMLKRELKLKGTRAEIIAAALKLHEDTKKELAASY